MRCRSTAEQLGSTMPSNRRMYTCTCNHTHCHVQLIVLLAHPECHPPPQHLRLEHLERVSAADAHAVLVLHPEGSDSSSADGEDDDSSVSGGQSLELHL